MAVLSRLTPATTTLLRHLPLVTTRSHSTSSFASAAAQPQVDYDHFDPTVDGKNPPVAAVDTEGSRPVRGVQWVFIGNPKHLYAEMISKILQVPHISITTLLRQDLSPHSPLYKQIAEAINRKKLVPETIIFGLLSKRLEDGRYKGETGFILDGIPRTRLQAEILDQLVDIDLVVNFKCSGDDFQARGFPADSAVSSDRTKSDFSRLSKTTEDAEPKILTSYKEQMKLLEDYYQDQKKLIDFQVGNAPGETWKGLLAALHLQHVNAVHSSRRLTMGFRVP